MVALKTRSASKERQRVSLFMTAVLLLLFLPLSSPTACPNDCRHKGICIPNGSGGSRCSCFEGYTGNDCSLKPCPSGLAWVDAATATDTAHAMAVCSNMGMCNEQTGKCTCRTGFEGKACERMSCPNNCNGKGRCLSMREAASLNFGPYMNRSVTYSNWDADKIYGCVCDLGYRGFDCSKQFCPAGDDPLTTTLTANEAHNMVCTCADTCLTPGTQTVVGDALHSDGVCDDGGPGSEGHVRASFARRLRRPVL